LRISNLPGPSGWPDVDKIFAKYYRSGGAQRRSGTGLGLYLSRSMAERLGGTLRYIPDQQNIRFELWLPA
jgi:signal transduction histidine kinase